MNSPDDIIVGIMKNEQCYGQEKMITPEYLTTKCKAQDLVDARIIEAALVRLIDQDIIEYEMDDATSETTELWLLTAE